jgi:polysaccharide export outer membrane protein
VIVLLKEYVKPFITVAGEVARPGRIELHGRVTLVEAIALSGGFKDSAHRTQVLLLRKSASDMAEVKMYDLRKLMSASGLREDVALKSGDMLVIPRNALSKIEPFVRISEAGLYGLAQKFL